MKTFVTLLAALFLAANTTLAQTPVAAQDMAPKPANGWKRGGGFGLDLTGLGILNPRLGAGQNRFGIGGLGTYFADMKRDRYYWDNNISLQLGVIRIGGSEEDFQKSIDVLRATSKGGYAITTDGKWNGAALLIGQTSVLQTYDGNYLNVGPSRKEISRLFSPAQLQFHPGVEWKPDAHFSALLSPIGFVGIFVPNEAIAEQYIHGNEVGKTYRLLAVPSLNAVYKNKFFKDRVSFVSSLNLSSDWKNLDRVAMNFWQNNLSFAIYKGLSLDLFGEAAYDWYKPVIKDTNDNGRFDTGTLTAPTKDGDLPTSAPGFDKLERGTQFIGSFLLKYNLPLN